MSIASAASLPWRVGVLISAIPPSTLGSLWGWGSLSGGCSPTRPFWPLAAMLPFTATGLRESSRPRGFRGNSSGFAAFVAEKTKQNTNCASVHVCTQHAQTAGKTDAAPSRCQPFWAAPAPRHTRGILWSPGHMSTTGYSYWAACLLLYPPGGGRSNFILRSSVIDICSCSMTASSSYCREAAIFSCRNSRKSSNAIFSKRSGG